MNDHQLLDPQYLQITLTFITFDFSQSDPDNPVRVLLNCHDRATTEIRVVLVQSVIFRLELFSLQSTKSAKADRSLVFNGSSEERGREGQHLLFGLAFARVPHEGILSNGVQSSRCDTITYTQHLRVSAPVELVATRMEYWHGMSRR